MDVLNLDVPSEEEESINRDVAPKWVEGGMTCLVAECGTKMFNKYCEMRTHWNLVHYRTINYFSCGVCNFKHIKRNQLQRHYRLKHKKEVSEAMTLTSGAGSRELNKRYVDPKGQLMPVVEVSGGHAKSRDAAAQLRKAAVLQTSLLNDRNTTVTARDQEVKIKIVDGQCSAVLQANPRWHRGTGESVPYVAPRELDQY